MNDDKFTLAALELEVAVLNERLNNALAYLDGNEAIGYGMSAAGVENLRDILSGEWQ